jgi:hypothetical protein
LQDTALYEPQTRPIFNVGPFDLVERRRRHQIFREPSHERTIFFWGQDSSGSSITSPQAASTRRRVRSRRQMAWRRVWTRRDLTAQCGFAHMHAESKTKQRALCRTASTRRVYQVVSTPGSLVAGSTRTKCPRAQAGMAAGWRETRGTSERRCALVGRRHRPTSRPVHDASGWRRRRRAP